ncbi:uncharacterized protein [Pleurodeles waltl]|uniref:uncharacterized protein isoform X2 n=1 Tax=Pleurodeles waltl TaxID=8319 RepID=UPI003709B9F5
MTGEECTLMARAFGTVKPEVLEIEIGQTSHDGSHCESDDTEWDGTSSAGTIRRHEADMASVGSFQVSHQRGKLMQGPRGKMSAKWTEVRRRSVNWSIEELEGLLNALRRSPHLGLLMSSKHMSTLHEWQTVEDDMRQEGFCRSADQCRLKMKGIRRVFHHLRLGWGPGGKNTTSLPHWFPRMMDLWRQAGKPRFNTPLIKGNSSSKTVNARRTQERSKLIDVEHKEGGRRTFPCRMEEGHPKPHYDFHMHSSGIMLKEHGLKGIPSSRQEHMVSLPSGTTTSRFTSQETTLERGKHVPLSSYIPHQSQRMPQCRPASTRPQAHFKQSQEEPASLPVPATCQASEDNTELLKELNTRVQRLEDYHQRTNELLQQVVSILQTQSNVLQRSVN